MVVVLGLLLVLLPEFVLEPVFLAVPEEPVVALFVFEEEAEVELPPVFLGLGLAVCDGELEAADGELAF